jgi:hypothetical protein
VLGFAKVAAGLVQIGGRFGKDSWNKTCQLSTTFVIVRGTNGIPLLLPRDFGNSTQHSRLGDYHLGPEQESISSS